MIVMEIKDIFTETEKINIYKDGNATTYIAGDKSLAFILSQDQTLRCWYVCFVFFLCLFDSRLESRVFI